MKVAVLGGGPSGAMAAWACIQYGCDVTIYDRYPEKVSVGNNHGVFALFDSCDLLLSNSQRVRIGVIGAKGMKEEDIRRAYSLKVYGTPSQSVSVQKYLESGDLLSYNQSEAYSQILEIIGSGHIKEANISNKMDVLGFLDDADIVICTVPAPVIFPSDIWPSNQAFIYHSEAPDNEAFMMYNVNQHIPWYRCSAIFGRFSMEYTERPANTDKEYVQVRKVIDPPISPDSITDLPEVWFAGRYGAWQKDILTEDVYWNTLTRLSNVRQGRAEPLKFPAGLSSSLLGHASRGY